MSVEGVGRGREKVGAGDNGAPFVAMSSTLFRKSPHFSKREPETYRVIDSKRSTGTYMAQKRKEAANTVSEIHRKGIQTNQTERTGAW